MPGTATESALSVQVDFEPGGAGFHKSPSDALSSSDDFYFSSVGDENQDLPRRIQNPEGTLIGEWGEKSPNSPVTSVDNQFEDDDSEQYPEGGLKAWSVVIGSWCAMFACFSFLNIGGVYQAYISTHQLVGYSESTVGWIFSLCIFLAFFCGIQIGPCFDAKGPLLLVSSGSVCLVLGVFTLAESTKLWHFFLTYSLLCGVGTSLLFTPSIACIAHYFKARRGLATGLGCTAGSIGGTIFPLVLPILFESVGYAWATRIVGIIFVVFLALANILMRPRLPPKANPTMRDFLPDFRILFEGRYELLLCTVGIFAIEWGLFVPLTYIGSWAMHTGTGDSNFGYRLLAIINASSFFGRWIPGFVADRIGPFNTIILACGFCLVGLVGFWLPASIPPGIAGNSDGAWNNVALVVIFAVLFGFGSGSGISLTPVCVGKLCKVRDYGRYYATCYTVVSLGCLTGVPIAGALIQACGGEYLGLIGFSVGCYVLGIVGFVAARILLTGWRWNTAC